MEFGKYIKELRFNCLLNQEEFAKAIGVSFSTVNRWENGKSIPNFKTIRLIESFCAERQIPFNTNCIWKGNIEDD